jgi:hypothetical protein
MKFQHHLALGATLLLTAASSQAAPVQLLTPKQAAQPDLPHNQLSPVASKAPDPGAPVILFDKPKSGTTTAAPFPVKVRFVAAKDAKILTNTMKVQVLKVVPISIVSTVKPYLTPAGIYIPEATIPAGKYDLRVYIADSKGREGTAEGKWVVK